MTAKPSHYCHLMPLHSIGVFVCALLVLSSCGGSLKVLEKQGIQETPRALKGLVLFPIADMTPGADATEIILRTVHMESWLLDHIEAPLITPLDYAVFKHPDDLRSVVEDTDWVKGKSISELRGWASLWIQVTENRATNTRDFVDRRKTSKTRGKSFRSYGVEATLRVEVQLRDAVTGRRLAMVVLQDVDNPLNQSLSGDNRPTLTALVIRALKLVFPSPEEPTPPKRRVRSAGKLSSVMALARWSTPGLPSLKEKIATRDMIEKQAAIYTLWRRVAPKISVRDSDAATQHPGLFITQEAAPLKLHDVLTSVGGKLVTSRASLDRILRGCKGDGCKARIWRDKKWVEVALPTPPLPPPKPTEAD